MQFIKKNQLQLINGGYLTNKEESPITNSSFIDAQKRAEILCKVAQEAKDKDFKGVSPSSIEEIRKNIIQSCTEKQAIKVFETPEKPTLKTIDTLTKEAMQFINFNKDLKKVEYLNQSIQEFATIHEFEEFGLFFENGISKLSKIYTINDVKEALEILYTKLH